MKHTAFFGDGVKTFALPTEQILELERKTGAGVGAIYLRMLTAQFQLSDVMEVIRLGLIGGGTPPQEAQTLVDAYARPTPIIECFQLAADILDARWNGTVEPTPAPIEPKKTSSASELAASIRESYERNPV